VAGEVILLTPAEVFVAKKLRSKLTSAIHFLSDARACAEALTPEVLAQLNTQEALTVLARHLGKLRDIAKGEHNPREGEHG
jgi:hypothetical protein